MSSTLSTLRARDPATAARGGRPVGCLLVVLAAAGLWQCRSQDRSRPVAPPPTCDRACVAGSLVDLLDARGEPVCQGLALAQDGARAFIVTAAHCAGAAQSVVDGAHGRGGAVVQRWTHPRRDPAARDATYDVAVLEVVAAPGRFSRTPTVAGAGEGDTGSTVEVAQTLARGAAPDWSKLVVDRRSPLRLQLHLSAGSLCHGSSGAPILVEGPRGYELLGVVSAGRADCNGPLGAARVSGRQRAFIDAVLAQHRAVPFPVPCAECLDALASLDLCLNPIRRCGEHPECVASLRCLEGCDAGACERDCAPQASAELTTLVRCGCAQGCAAECGALCPARQPN
jgi:hypothetical protein